MVRDLILIFKESIMKNIDEVLAMLELEMTACGTRCTCGA